MRVIFIGIFVLSIAISPNRLSGQLLTDTNAKPAASIPTSRLFVERELSRTLDLKNSVVGEIEFLEQFQKESVSPDKTLLSEAKLTDADATRVLEALRTATKNIKPNNLLPATTQTVASTTAGNVSPVDNSTWAEFETAITAVQQIVRAPVADSVNKIYRGARSDYSSSVQSPLLVREGLLLKEIQDAISRSDGYNVRSLVWEKLKYCNTMRNAVWPLVIPEVQKILGDMTKEVEKLTVTDLTSDFASEREAALKQLEKVSQRIVDMISRRQQTLKILSDSISSLDKQLAALDVTARAQQADQASIDQQLVYAVYGMIGAIVVMFLTMRIFPVNLATKMVTERTAVELLSMGFLLLTVIILGSGKVLEGQALGPILGAIAGYIFGRKERSENS